MNETKDIGIEMAQWVGAAAGGALLMYMLDPDRGGARRARSTAAVRNARTRAVDAAGKAWHAAGALRHTAHAARLEHAAARSGAECASGNASSKATGAAARSGPALTRIGQAASAALDAQPNETTRAGARLRARVRDAIQPGPDGEWAPPLRTSAVAGGSLLALYGLVRRSPLGWMLGLAGAALLARSAANQPLKGVLHDTGLGLSDLRERLHLRRDQTVDFENSIFIDAAPDEVYDHWTNYANFPRFMSNVVDVHDLDHGRSRWVVRGPAGSEFEWTSRLTEQSRPQRLAWRSEAGAEIQQSGSVELTPHRGGTHVTVRMSYTPPAGAVGHGLAALLGADPKASMDADLARLKAFIEHGPAQPGGVRPRSGSRVLH